jgi:PKD repeat protein
VSTVPPGGPPGQAVRVSAPSSTAALPDLVVAADGTRLVLVDRHADGADNDLTGHVQGLFAAPGAPLGGLEEVSGVQDRTNFTAFNEARGALGGGRATAVSTADDQSGVPNQRVYLAERDATPPVFDAISVPASATPGSRIALAAGATDALTPARIDWDFGDGSSASGAAATHAYGAPGSFTVTVRAHDAAGNRAVQTRTVVVAVAPGRDGAGAPPPPGPDLTAPRVTRPTTANARFRVAGGSTELIGAATKKAPAGTVFRLSVDERSTLVLSFTGKLAGRKKGSHCIAGRKTGTACSVAVAPGTLLRTSRGPGAVSIPFSGRIGGARLEPGSYRLAVSAIDAAGNRSAEQTVTFKVVSR